jgi:ABC-type transporter Mla MlaB component
MTNTMGPRATVLKTDEAGRLDAKTVPNCWNNLERQLRGASIKSLEVEASNLEFSDGAGLALLRYLNMGRMKCGAAECS